jgi:glycine cleavage system aminomethyltransferase T
MQARRAYERVQRFLITLQSPNEHPTHTEHQLVDQPAIGLFTGSSFSPLLVVSVSLGLA